MEIIHGDDNISVRVLVAGAYDVFNNEVGLSDYLRLWRPSHSPCEVFCKSS